MTRAELEAAYQRAVQLRNYAWRRERNRKSKQTSSAPPMRDTSKRDTDGATDKATADRRHRLHKI
eukprot:3607465-Pleurochrysis_carterae.AAC.1